MQSHLTSLNYDFTPNHNVVSEKKHYKHSTSVGKKGGDYSNKKEYCIAYCQQKFNEEDGSNSMIIPPQQHSESMIHTYKARAPTRNTKTTQGQLSKSFLATKGSETHANYH
jgi:hypothetical protein